MSYKYAILLSLLIAFLLTTSTPSANAQTANIGRLNITGQICCRPNGTCPGQGLSGLPVTVDCNIGNSSNITTLGKNTTDTNGFFDIPVDLVPALIDILLDLPALPCVVNVQLPADFLLCQLVTDTTDMLTSPLQIVSALVSGVLGLVLNAGPSGFHDVNI